MLGTSSRLPGRPSCCILHAQPKPIGLAAVLDIAEPGDRVFMISYGSGAGSDGFDITVTDNISNYDRSEEFTIQNMIKSSKFLDYASYLKFREKLKLEGE